MAEQGSWSRISLSFVLKVIAVVVVLGGLVVIADRVGGASGSGVTGAASVTPVSCTGPTSAAGNNLGVSDTISFSWTTPRGQKKSNRWADTCIVGRPSTVRIVYCNGNAAGSSVVSCPAGQQCTNGACTPSPPVCGNGVKEGAEQCDAGGIAQTCAAPYGGECTYCDASCHTVVARGPYCGDGSVNGPEGSTEQCDDGNTVSGDGCSANCLTSCTDTDPNNEVLVVGTLVAKGPGYSNTTSDVCSNINYLEQGSCSGDTTRWTPNVFCGSNLCSDGVCTGTCTPGVTTTKCGVRFDGKSYTETMTCRADGHSYDYGSYTVGATCPAGTVCGSGTCQPATVVCGNGVKEGAEQCDDGNIADGDGCSGLCQYQCTETDSGDDLSIKGSIVGYNATNTVRLTRWQDFCLGALSEFGARLHIYEYYCAGGLAAERHASCPSGQSCTDGRCA